MDGREGAEEERDRDCNRAEWFRQHPSICNYNWVVYSKSELKNIGLQGVDASCTSYHRGHELFESGSIDPRNFHNYG